MQIKQTLLTKLKPYPQNPRTISERAVDTVAKSIDRFGFQAPIVADEDHVIIVGHTRYEAAKKLGLTKVPVVTAKLTEDEAKAYRIADNRTQEYSGWNIEDLTEELKALDGLEVPGFTDGEITALIEEQYEDMNQFMPGKSADDHPGADWITISLTVERDTAEQMKARCEEIIAKFNEAA